MEIEEHYSQLLGTQEPWEISKIDLNLSEHRVDIEIEYTDVTGTCPECGASCPKHDDRKQRSWRHLDTMQFATYLHCSVPRACLLRQVRCKKHGAKTVKVPWAARNSRFTLLFEGFVARVLQAARSIEEARKLLGLNWHQVNAIKARAVQRGLSRREAVTIPYLGIDEKQFRKGHRYISSLVDLQQGRVLDVVENRTEEACKALIEQSLTTEQQQQVTGVALDMWKAYMNSVEEKLPQADIVHDRFHISQHLNEAVDKVRRQENKEFKEAGDRRLVGTRYSWLVIVCRHWGTPLFSSNSLFKKNYLRSRAPMHVIL